MVTAVLLAPVTELIDGVFNDHVEVLAIVPVAMFVVYPSTLDLTANACGPVEVLRVPNDKPDTVR